MDVQPIGPRGSWVGLAAMNGWFHQLTGVHMFLYAITDWLELVPFGFMLAFALLGRLISGVHWLSDIIGSILLSAGLVLLYAGCQNRLTA